MALRERYIRENGADGLPPPGDDSAVSGQQFQELKARLPKMKKADVDRVVRKYLQMDNFSVAIVSDKAQELRTRMVELEAVELILPVVAPLNETVNDPPELPPRLIVCTSLLPLRIRFKSEKYRDRWLLLHEYVSARLSPLCKRTGPSMRHGSAM